MAEPTRLEGFLQETHCFQYDEFSDLLGGATWQGAFERWILSGLSLERQQTVAQWEDYFSLSPQFLYSREKSHPLEILWLKWNLFIGLIQAVQAYHQKHRRPHLGLQPASLWVDIPPLKSHFLPVRWSFSLPKMDNSQASPCDDPQLPPDLLPRLFKPPGDVQKVYSAPILRNPPSGEGQMVTALVRSLEQVRGSAITPTAQDGIRALLEIQIISEDIRPAEFSEMDVFKMSLRFPGEQTSSILLWAGKKASLERGLLLQGISDPMNPSLWTLLQNAQHQVFNRSMITAYKTFHVPCDLYSLGMLLLRTLLVNDQQSMTDIDQRIGRISERLDPMVRGMEAEDPKTLSQRLRTLLMEEGGLFSKGSILYREEDRRLGFDSIPDGVWYDALLLSLRLVTWIPGFSYCRNHGDYEMEHPDRLMERVRVDVERLGRRIQMELFGSSRRNREVLEACNLVRKEFVEARSG